MTHWIERYRIPIDETFSYPEAKAIVDDFEMPSAIGRSLFRAFAEGDAIVIMERVYVAGCDEADGQAQAA